MSDRRNGRGAPIWWLVFRRELAELWIGGKALVLVFIFSLVLGVITYVVAANSELSLIPANEMVYETLKTAIAVALFIGLIIGSDSLSGERERSTLEHILLTPTSRRQVVFGKLLAAFTPWPACLAISIPFLRVLSQGDPVWIPAILWGSLTGTTMAIAYTGVGMLVSFWSNTNKTSYFVSLGIYVLGLVPAQLPGKAQAGFFGQWLQMINPMAATSHFLSKMLVNNRHFSEFWNWLLAPMLLALAVLFVLIWFAAPALKLEAGRDGIKEVLRTRFAKRGRLATATALTAASLLFAAPSMVQAQTPPAPSANAAASQVTPASLDIAIDVDVRHVKVSDKIPFTTTVTNRASETSRPLILAMNIINLKGTGDPVDPEDWSPQRTQYVEALGAGQSATHEWQINAILDGEFVAYMVVLPEPTGPNTTSQPVASSAIHLTVAPYTKLNPSGVLPYVIATPVVLILLMVYLFRRRRREIDTGGATAS